MDISEEKKDLYELLDFTDTKKEYILNNLINRNIYYNSIDVSDDVYKDTSIDQWCELLPNLEGSKILIKKLIHNPINDIELLKNRQLLYKYYDIDFTTLKDYENDILWIYSLNEEIKQNNLINILFPSTYIINNINYINIVLEFYHIYKIYLTPLSNIIYPLISFLAPWYYLNKVMRFNLSLQTYVKMLYEIFKMIFSFSSGNLKSNLVKIFSISFYIILFVYNIYQTIEYSYMLYDIKNTLYKKISNLNIFLKEAIDIIKKVPNNIIKPFINLDINFDINSLILDDNMTNIYRIWKHNEIKENISKILLSIYAIDIIYSISKLKKNWCLPCYNDKVEIWKMKNPLLPMNQTTNPVDLNKNIIITGPNAAGKTTYVKTILFNIILSQTFGICYAVKANTIIYDNIASFMRITDVLGSKSYFEAEAEYCLKMMTKAKILADNNKKGLFLMDEPMHSTPPTEGMATAFAVSEYLGNLQGINIILTTHFHKLTELATIYPNKFINISVEAIPKENGGFIFPYQVKRGYSYQCIAIELLDSKEFPKSVIESAINMKNKIYNEINR
jgi:hypothetical protein